MFYNNGSINRKLRKTKNNISLFFSWIILLALTVKKEDLKLEQHVIFYQIIQSNTSLLESHVLKFRSCNVVKRKILSWEDTFNAT